MPGPRPRVTLESAFAAMPVRALRMGAVQAVVADMDDWAAWEDEAWALLDAHERARALRQRLPHERGARVLAYALHRLLLARALGCAPAGVPLYRDARGCPRLIDDVACTSLSHADGLFAFAVSAAGPVGVDIEPVSRCGSMEEIAQQVCHPDEWSRLASRPHGARARELLALWVRKEAVLKAAGMGLEVPMDSFVAVHAGPVRVPGFITPWRTSRIDAGPCAMAAVACAEGAKVACVRMRPRQAAQVGLRHVAAG